ncbi:hypothetical protein, partial [Mesorhizobium amorphae]|uniref:hypothetical protein n=1 Tax=Mesorhizobium amorphae TaxID=71433 RepID=UPI001AEE2175
IAMAAAANATAQPSTQASLTPSPSAARAGHHTKLSSGGESAITHSSRRTAEQLLRAVMQVESVGNVHAVSSRGARWG